MAPLAIMPSPFRRLPPIFKLWRQRFLRRLLRNPIYRLRLELHAQAKINGQPLVSPKLIRFHELTEDEYFCTEDGAKNGVTFENTSETEPLVCLRYFGPDVNPDAPAMGAYRKNKF